MPLSEYAKKSLAGYLSEPSRVIVTTTAFTLGARGDAAALAAMERAAARDDLTNNARQTVNNQLARLRRAS